MAMGGKAGEVFTEINVTPLTDVFLVLLVIMILVAPLINQTVLKVDPPQAASNQKNQDTPEKNKIDVEVLGTGVIKVNGMPINPPDSLAIQQAIHNEQLKAGTDDLPLNLSSEPDAIEKNVVAVMDAAAGAGIKRMRVLPLRQLSK
jgi:biopolymer transport protein ExbD/biopolymer transport protein TolR